MRLVVPTGAGGALDVLTRSIADPLSSSLKQSVVIENRGGAAGQLAAGPVAKAVGDPNYVLMGSLGIMSMSPHLYGHTMPYDVRRDFTPVVHCARAPNALVINPNVVPARNMQEFVRWAKAQKDPIPYATYGPGSVAHVSTLMMANAAGLNMVQVPYRDPPRLLRDLVKGDLPLVFDQPSPYVGFAKEGKLLMLAVTTLNRSPAYPDLPTMNESGFPGYDFANWFGFFMPSKVPAAAVERLRAATKPIVDAAKFRERFLGMGIDTTSEGDFPAMVESEFQRWGAFVRKNDIRISS